MNRNKPYLPNTIKYLTITVYKFTVVNLSASLLKVCVLMSRYFLIKCLTITK